MTSMTEHPHDHSGRDDRSDTLVDPVDEGISLIQWAETWWAYRLVIGTAVVGVAVLAGVVALAAVLILPSERLSSIQFRLTFEGAADGKYPNGMPFSSAEIISEPVLTEVVRVNDLERFGGYQALRDSIFILQSNPELDILAARYQAMLADTKLSSVDRSRIESEYEKKRDALKDPIFTLAMRQSERLGRMPPALIEKTLTETLATWARQAAEQKGATLYDVPVLTRNIMSKADFETEDYLSAVDGMRVTTKRILETLGKLEKLPGAQIIRTGKERISLAEITANLQDLQRFELEPLIGLIRSEGLTKSPQFFSRYIASQLFSLTIQRNAAIAHVKALEDGLQNYSAQRGPRSSEGRSAGSADGGRIAPSSEGQTVIPQLGESFLDRLVQLSTQTQTTDTQYRQRLTDSIITESGHVATLNEEVSFYEGLETAVKQRVAAGSTPPEIIAAVKAQSRKAFDAIGVALDRSLSLYRDLSLQNLTPAMIYQVTGSFTDRTVRSLPLRTAGLYWLLAVMVTLILASAGSLILHAFKASTAKGQPATVS